MSRERWDVMRAPNSLINPGYDTAVSLGTRTREREIHGVFLLGTFSEFGAF